MFDAIFRDCVNGRLELLNRNQKNQGKQVREFPNLRVLTPSRKGQIVRPNRVLKSDYNLGKTELDSLLNRLPPSYSPSIC